MSEWISVEDRLPESGVDVLVAYHWKRGGDLFAFDVEFVEEGDWIYRRADSSDNITHWTPLPSPTGLDNE